jgi:hypothetical protein
MPGHISSLPLSKKRKVKDDAGFGTSVKRLENDITRAISTNASLNSLADLLDLAVAARDAQNTSKAIYALYRVFVQLITDTKLSTGGDEAARIVKTWLWERLNTYVEFLGGLMKDEEKMLRVCVILRSLSFWPCLLTSYRSPRYRYYSRFRNTCHHHIPMHQHHLLRNLNSTCPISARSCLISSCAHPAPEASKVRMASLTKMS